MRNPNYQRKGESHLFLAAALLLALPAVADPIVKNGDFEQPDPKDPSRPAFWDKPDGLGVQWTQAPDTGSGKPHGKAIRMDTSISEIRMVEQWRKVGLSQWNIPNAAKNPIATTYGLSFYSDPFPVKKGQAYRVSFDMLGKGGAKVWVRGYGLIRNVKRRRYEAVVTCEGKKDAWVHHTQVFHPTRYRPKVTEMKVMLFAYYPPRVYWFDNVRIEPISDAEYERDK